MDSFYNTVLIVAVILLILGLTYTGYLLYYYRHAGETWPKTKGACPDTWIDMGKTVEDKRQCMIPVNCANVGRNRFATEDPNNTEYSEVEGVTVYTFDEASGMFVFENLPKCDLKIWAEKNEIQWDGITNYNDC